MSGAGLEDDTANTPVCFRTSFLTWPRQNFDPDDMAFAIYRASRSGIVREEPIPSYGKFSQNMSTFHLRGLRSGAFGYNKPKAMIVREWLE